MLEISELRDAFGRFTPQRRNGGSYGKLFGDEPLRAQMVTSEEFEDLAETIAAEHQGGSTITPGRALFRRFEHNVHKLHESYEAFADAAKNNDFLTPGAEWLLDNYHVIQQHVRSIRRDLPRNYYRSLPKLSSGHFANYPRVYHLIVEYITHSDAVVSFESLVTFVSTYQKTLALTIGELWAVPIMLRLGLIENLRRLAQVNLKTRNRRKEAQLIFEEVFEQGAAQGSSQKLISLAARARHQIDTNPLIAVDIIRKLRSEGKHSSISLHWLEEVLRELTYDPDELDRSERQNQAANQISIGNTVTSLKSVGSLDWHDWFEAVSLVDKALRRDPAAVYAKSDFTTRNRLRSRIEGYARALKISEEEVAGAALSLAQKADAIDCPNRKALHVGYYFIGDGQGELEAALGYRPSLGESLRRKVEQYAFALYISSFLFLCLVFALFTLTQVNLENVPLVPLFLISALLVFVGTSLAHDIVQWTLTLWIKPKPLPKLDFSDGIPQESRAVVTVHAIFKSKDAISAAADGLEVRYLANEDPHLCFLLLADLHDADQEALATDVDLVEYARELIEHLNIRHGVEKERKFRVFFRGRVWCESERRFMGWERKRGKIMEFNKLLLGDLDTTFQVDLSDVEDLIGTPYVITLDGDTQLPRGTAGKMLGTIAHPLNKAEFDEKSGRVVRGYGVIQPRAAIAYASAHVSRFSRVFAGQAGIDPYTQAVSDVYQDVFGEGSYIGKGVYDVEVFERALRGRVPASSLLSHDLFEGNFARVGLATDIELPDEFPSRYNVFARRSHRWVRGDWQLIPWTFWNVPNEKGEKHATPLSPLGRWKLVDNLRRSLLAPAAFLLLVLTWLFLAEDAILVSFLIVLVIAFPVYANLANACMISPVGIAIGSYVLGVGRDLLRLSQQAILTVAFLPFQAYLMSHAILVTLYRVYFSRTHLLEWETALASEKRLGTSFRAFSASMLSGQLLCLLVLLAIYTFQKPSLPMALPFLGLWCISPWLAWRISLPISVRKGHLNQSDRLYLKDIAWRTWRYFDECMTAERHFLIPDNLQLVPKPVVAERTSPTNIGLSLLSIVSAYDLGFISSPDGVSRVSDTVEHLLRLERFKGHFYNWYDVRNLSALHPRYISTVDSGNLAGHCIALKEALVEYHYSPFLSPRFWEGAALNLSDIARLKFGGSVAVPESFRALSSQFLSVGSLNFAEVYRLIETARAFRVDESARAFRMGLGKADPERAERLNSDLKALEHLRPFLRWVEAFERVLDVVAGVDQATSKEWVDFRKNLEGVQKVITQRGLTPSLLLRVQNRLLRLSKDISRLTIHGSGNGLSLFRDELLPALEESVSSLESFVSAIDRLVKRIDVIVEEMDFTFLYDEQKHLFAIGYSIESANRDKSYYDLLASEARLTSLVAIAKGDVPQKHWFHLGRSLANSLGGKALLSWSGTMFEYLMPILVTKDYEGTLLSRTYQAVVRTQRMYASRRKVPWGISESGYSGVDFEKTYQYRAFGVPGLGLKRGLSEDLVISPYSCILALPIDPDSVLENLRSLERLGVKGAFGFYEAVDYTQERLSSEENHHIVESFLAHHQGMSLVSIVNFLDDNVFQERFHRDARIRTVEMLLHERFPDRISTITPHQVELSSLEEEQEQRVSRAEVFFTPHTEIPRTRLLSNDRLSLMVDNSGSGYTMLDSSLLLSRWREDSIDNSCGLFIFLRDLDSGQVWSNTYQPTRVEPERYEAIFNPDKIEFRRRDFGIGCHTEIVVSPEDNVEIRRITLSNFSAATRDIELTSYGEVALATIRADAAHPAYSKMFIESEFIADRDALLLSRRPRSEDQTRLYLFHMLNAQVVWEKTHFESSRLHFIGRGRTVHAPRVLDPGEGLTETVGPVLDPVFGLRTRVEVDPGTSVTLSFITGVTDSREEADRLLERYGEHQSIHRAFEMSWSQSNVELRHENFTIAKTHLFQHLGTALLFNIPELRGAEKSIAQNRLHQSGFWRFGISGDFPVVFARLTDASHKALAIELLSAHEYLRLRGLSFDLVILNEFAEGYLQTFQEELELMIRHSPSARFFEQNGGIFLRSATQLSVEDCGLLEAAARVVLYGTKGSLEEQLQLSSKQYRPLAIRKQSFSYLGEKAGPFHPPKQDLEFFNGIGGFLDQGRTYGMVLHGDQRPPLPWSNVLANPKFGCLVTESGSGFTWSENSRENRLSVWSNDPVSDPASEALYIRDAETGLYWCPTPGPVETSDTYSIEHSFGRTEFTTQIQRIYSRLSVFVAPEEKLKFWHLHLVNGDHKARKLSLYLYVDWVLGVLRSDSYRYLVSSFDEPTGTLQVVNHYNNEFAGRYVFMGSSEKIVDYTADKREFIGRNRDVTAPYVLESAVTSSLASLVRARGAEGDLLKKVGAGFEPCGVIRVELSIEPGQSKDLCFFLGEGASPDEVHYGAAIGSYPARVEERQSETERFWEQCVDSVVISTPDKSFDILMNGWLLYQTVACRLFARSAFFQSGGAIGYRDQLQDTLACTYYDPTLLRDQILLHASRQFVQGDVQHWWHPPTGRGVRTKISDDYLWLPFAVIDYLERTGDRSLLDEVVPFIEGDFLDEKQHEAYIVPQVSSHRGSIYEHCVIALDRALHFGVHGLPFIGAGDWNDGMNEVGIEGKGESVWLGWFLQHILRGFIPIVTGKRDQYRASLYARRAEELVQSIEQTAWDGNWYLRAFFDDGTPMGSHTNDECRIDSLSQSWSVICGTGDPERSRTAMDHVFRHLVKNEHGIIRLLAPAFDKGSLSPGYIKGYLPGIRENGGQYTHAAAWVILATAKLGRGNDAHRLFSMVNPVNHTSSAESVAKYQAEPYVTCGDVYGEPPHEGRAGWSWYTGSAGWLYRVGLEYMLGISQKADRIEIHPCIPSDWETFRVTWKNSGRILEFVVSNPEGVESGVKDIVVAGKRLQQNWFSLKEHVPRQAELVAVEVRMGRK